MKRDWTWDEKARVVNNPLSEDLDELYDKDTDYDLIIYRDAAVDDIELLEGMTDTILMAAVDLTQNHLD